MDYPIAIVLAGIGVALAVGVLNFIGFWGLLVAPIAGGGLAEIIRWAVRRRRGRRLPLVAAIGGALGVLPHLGFPVLALVMALGGGLGTRGASGEPVRCGVALGERCHHGQHAVLSSEGNSLLSAAMLTDLTIRNFAIIDDLQLTLGSGLSVFTGETGAGKSIIVDALELLLGERAESNRRPIRHRNGPHRRRLSA